MKSEGFERTASGAGRPHTSKRIDAATHHGATAKQTASARRRGARTTRALPPPSTAAYAIMSGRSQAQAPATAAPASEKAARAGRTAAAVERAMTTPVSSPADAQAPRDGETRTIDSAANRQGPPGTRETAAP